MVWKMIAIDDRIMDLATLLESDKSIAERFSWNVIDSRNIHFREKISSLGSPCSLDLYQFLVSRSIREEQASNDIINKIESGKYDVAFLDYNLGPQGIAGGDEGFQRGLRLIRILTEHFPEMPIIVISGQAELGHAQAPEVMDLCVEIYEKARNRDDIVQIICNSERTLRTLEKNALLRTVHRMDPAGKPKNQRLPLKLKCDLDANRIEISSAFSPFSRASFWSLGVQASYCRRSSGGRYTYEDGPLRTYGALLRRKWQIDVDRLQALGIEVFSLSVILKGEVLFKTDFRWLADPGTPPTYLHYLKNFPYLEREFLYSTKPLSER